jgi:Tn3 transposase DDE domain
MGTPDWIFARADEFLFFRTPFDSATQVRANGGQGANLVVRFLQHDRSFIVYWQAREISRVLSQCDPVANAVDTSLLEHVSPIDWDNVVLYGQYILDRKLVRRRRRSMKDTLSV